MPLEAKEPSIVSPAIETATALTYDDVLLKPKHSNILPSAVNVTTKLTRNVTLNVPIISAAMDTVTEAGMAIAMAQLGGIGIIHKNLSISGQAAEVDRVKRSESGMIVNPITLSPQANVYQALELMRKYRISGVPITSDGQNEGRLVGILTNRDLRFHSNADQPISEVMTRNDLITVPVGTTLDQAKEILHRKLRHLSLLRSVSGSGPEPAEFAASGAQGRQGPRDKRDLTGEPAPGAPGVQGVPWHGRAPLLPPVLRQGY